MLEPALFLLLVFFYLIIFNLQFDKTAAWFLQSHLIRVYQTLQTDCWNIFGGWCRAEPLGPPFLFW